MLISLTFHNRPNIRHTQFGSVFFIHNAHKSLKELSQLVQREHKCLSSFILIGTARKAMGRQMVEAKAEQPGPPSLTSYSIHRPLLVQRTCSSATGLLGLQGHKACHAASLPTVSEQTLVPSKAPLDLALPAPSNILCSRLPA